ncbi:hypothetical protein [Ammoniphilus resinae]|uniref:Uncharacterized protein n=1 Tax=Ammoniphilus resinae TaxID=861532 RepID=A0ABS4GNF4_9BACL|nr:hypothetical protein [Ammoniphilus resinae]MBP1931776.1 hypothetical protein [Ammoniphilus resinae]
MKNQDQMQLEVERETINGIQDVHEEEEMRMQPLEVKRLLERGMKDPCLVLMVIDDGLLRRGVARKNNQELMQEFQTVIENYLQENGDDHGITEDGYAVVCQVDPFGDEEEFIWTYPFDGDESISEAIQRLQKNLFQ